MLKFFKKNNYKKDNGKKIKTMLRINKHFCKKKTLNCISFKLLSLLLLKPIYKLEIKPLISKIGTV